MRNAPKHQMTMQSHRFSYGLTTAPTPICIEAVLKLYQIFMKKTNGNVRNIILKPGVPGFIFFPIPIAVYQKSQHLHIRSNAC